MLIAKIEVNAGGDTEFKDFETEREIAIYLAKNPTYKLRLVGIAHGSTKRDIIKLSEVLRERLLAANK